MGVKYTHTFHQLKKYDKTDPDDATEWRIDILQDSWLGASTEIECDRDSIVLSREGDLLDVVQGTKLQVSLINQTEGQYKEFREADWGEYEVRLWKNGNNSSELPTPLVDQRDVSFTSSGDFINLGNVDGLAGLSAMSLKMKINLSSGFDNGSILFKDGVISILYNQSTNVMTASLVTSTGTAVATATLNAETDYDVYISYIPNFFAIYVDEVLVGWDTSETGTIATNTNDMYIGRYSFYVSIPMDLDYIKLYDEVVPFDSADVLKFVGYNQSEIYTEQFDQPPYSSVLEFTCGLNHLKNVKFNEAENEVIETGVDANTNAVSPSIDLTGTAKGARFEVDYISGTVDNLSIEIQTSPDDAVWTSLGYNVVRANLNDIGANYVRLKVVTVEGAASVVNWKITPLYVGQKSLIEVIRLCLNKLPNTRSIIEFVNIYEDSINSTTTDSMLNQIFVDCSVYKLIDEADNETEFYCHKVLTECLKVFGVNLYQANGDWTIARVQEYNDTTIYYRLFSAFKGNESNLTITSTGSYTANKRTITGPSTANNELILVAPASELSIEPPLNRVVVKYDQTNINQEDSSLIKNGDFSSYILTPQGFEIPDYWGFSSGGSKPWTYNSVEWQQYNGTYELYFTFDPATQGIAYAFDSNIWMAQPVEQFRISTLDALVLSFSFYYENTIVATTLANAPIDNIWFQNHFKVYFQIEITFGTYYLHGDNVNGYTWVNSYGRATIESVGINTEPIATGLGNYSIKGDYDVNSILPNLPITGLVDYNIRVYQPYSNVLEYTDYTSDFSASTSQIIRSRKWKLTYLPEEVEPKEELILSTTINDGENLEEITVSHADGTNSATLNSYRISSGAITDQWTRRGESDDTNILSLFLIQLGVLKGDYTRILNAKVIGEIDIFNTIEQTVGGIVNEYYIKTYSWNIATNEYDFTLSEIGNAGIAITIKTDGIFTEGVSLDTITPKVFNWDDGVYERSEAITLTDTTPIDTEQRTLNNYI